MKKSLRPLVFLFIALAFNSLCLAQQFQKTYGGTQDDRAYSVIQTADGGYCVSGNTGSSASTQYLHVVKFDNSMNVQWTFRINASSPNQTGRSIIQTADGGYVIAGNNNGIGPSAGTRDYYILKLNSAGSLQWTRVLDQNGAGNNSLFSIAELPSNGGFICSGTTDASCGTANIALIKLNSDGTCNWKSNLGACNGSGDSWPARVVVASDGGFVIAGTSNSGSNGGGNLYLIKTNSAGAVSWGKTVGGSSYIDQGFALAKSNDGGYAVAGYTKSYPTAHAGVGKNVYVVKFDSGGTLQWTRTVGGTSSSGSGDNIANSIIQTSGDNGYLVAGSTSFYGTGGGIDGYAAKLTSSGALSWTKTFGGSSTDEIQSVIQNANGDFVMAGLTASYGNPAAQFDWYLLKMASDGSACGPNLSSGGFGGTGGGTGTDTNNPTTSIADRGTAGTVSTFTASVTSMFSVSVSPTSTTICNGNSTTLTASGASGYTWSPSTGLNTTTGSTVVASPTISTTYTVTGTGGINCSPATAVVIVLPIMAVKATPSLTICKGQSTMLSAYGGTSYSWNTGATIPSIIVAPTTTTSYSVQVTNVLGCTAAFTRTVTVNSTTLAANINSITPNNCPNVGGGTMSVSATGGTSPYTYLWDASPVQTTSTATNLPDRMYMITVTDAQGCSAFDIDTIHTPQLPENDSLSEWTNSYNGSGNMADVSNIVAIHTDSTVYVAGVTSDDSSGNNYLIIKYSPAGEELWVKTYNGSGNGNDEATAMAIDASGNVYVTGSSVGSGTGTDYATIKYDKDGVHQWTSRYNGSSSGSDAAKAITINSSTVVVTGYITETTTGRNFGTVAYNTSSGSQLWLKTYAGTSSSSVDEAASIASASGFLYVTGRSTGSGGRDLVAIKYQSNGDTSWIRRYADQLGGDRLYEKDPVAVDGSGNVYVSGTLNDTTDIALLKYNSSGTLQWAKTYNGAGNSSDQVLDIILKGSSNIHVTGYAKGSTSNNDYATLSYESDGDLSWLQLYNGNANGSDIATAIAIDDSSNVYVTGGSVRNCTESDYTTIKYQPDGDMEWTQSYHGSDDGIDIPNDIASDALGNIYVIGGSEDSQVGFDAVTIKYNQLIPGQIGDIAHDMEIVAMGLLEISKNANIKELVYDNIITAELDTSHIYFYIILADLIEDASGIGIDLVDSMNSTLNDIFNTTNIDYLTDILNGITYKRSVLFPLITVPKLNTFDATERTQNPYIGHGFLEEDFPLNGFSGIDVDVPIEKTLMIEDVHSKPTWLVFPVLPPPPFIGPIPIPGGGGKNILLSECIFSNSICNTCNPSPSLGGISPTANFPTSCPASLTTVEAHIFSNADGCVSSTAWDDPSFDLTNYILLSSFSTVFDYWSQPPGASASTLLSQKIKKTPRPIRKYTYRGDQTLPRFKDGDKLTLCNYCSEFDDWAYEDRDNITGALGKNGIFELKRPNQLPLYFVLPFTERISYIATPDMRLFFGTQPVAPPTTCPDGKTKIIEDYQYRDINNYLVNNSFNYNTDYLASTDKNFIESFWKNNVITVGFLKNGAAKVDLADLLIFDAPLSGGPPQIFNTLIGELLLNSNGEYTVIGNSFLAGGTFPAGLFMEVYVQANFVNGESINFSMPIQLDPLFEYTQVIVDIRGRIKGFDPTITNYRISLYTL